MPITLSGLLTTGGYDSQTVDEQPWKGGFDVGGMLICAGHITFAIECRHFQRQGRCRTRTKIDVLISGHWIRCRLQGMSVASCVHGRYLSVYINMAVNYGYETFLQNTMQTTLMPLLARAQARQFCMQLQEGTFPYESTNRSLIGIGEIFLLPLDVLKIKRQTNPEAFRGRGLFRIIKDEGFALYRGWEWTAARNAPGSFAVSYLNSSLNSAFWR
jgi:hypothetical protein